VGIAEWVFTVLCAGGCCMAVFLVLFGVAAFLMAGTKAADPAVPGGEPIGSIPSESIQPPMEPKRVARNGPDLFDDEAMATVVAPPPPGVRRDAALDPDVSPLGMPPNKAGATIIAFDDDEDDDW